MFRINKSLLAVTTGSLVVLSGLSAPVISATDDPSRDVDKLMIVDCMLPGKVMRLGSGARYMSARRPIKTTGADCEIRGGEYVAYDRASYATSLKVWLPEAKAGDPKAQTYVGEMFEQGLGTTPDYATAVSWYRKAAEQGYDRAQMNLGSMYERGLGVEKDELEALNWYRKATGMGDDDLVLASEMEALEAEAEGLREALAASEAEVARLKESLSESRQKVNSSAASLTNAQMELETMRLRLATAETQGVPSADVSALNAEVQRKEAELAASRKELMDLRISFDRQQAELTAQLHSQDSGPDSYQALLELEGQKISFLENQVSQLTNSLELRQAELVNSNAQLAALRKQLEAQAANDQAATDASIAELTAIIESQRLELDRKSTSITAIEAEFRQQQQQLELAQTALRERQDKAAQSTEIDPEQQAQLAQDRSRVLELQNQVDSLSLELQLNRSTADSATEQLAVLQRQLEVANTRRATTEESLAELTQVIAAQQADMEEKALSISFLEQELTNQKNQLTAERAAYEQREKGLLESKDMVELEKETIATRLAQTEAQLNEYQRKLIESDRQIQSQQSEIVSGQKQIEQLEAEKQRMATGNALAAQTKQGELNIELARYKGENSALRTEIDAMESELSRLRNQVAMLDSSDSVAMRGYIAPMADRPTRPDLPDVDFGEYHALIIGNNNYAEFPDLSTPVNDARAIARMLEDKYGFKTMVLINADRYTILQTLNSYRERLSEQDNFLLYYAGHGTLDEKNDRGHWLPVDASPNNPANWISNVTITDYINTMAAKHIMVIADSCYSGTMAREVRPNLKGERTKKMEVSFYKKLSKIASRSALTSGGTQPVMDGGGGDHSIFARSLLNALEMNDGILQGPDLYLEVTSRVRSSSDNAIGQVPAFAPIQNTGDLGAPFFFVPT
jgi:hypothetical protein